MYVLEPNVLDCILQSLEQQAPQTKKQSLVCKGGTARGGKCLCGKKKTAKKLGPKRFACVPKRS